jgi:hypothetical protein
MFGNVTIDDSTVDKLLEVCVGDRARFEGPMTCSASVVGDDTCDGSVWYRAPR